MEALRLVSTINLSHEEWMYYRNNGITGSRIAAIMGESPFDTPLSVYLEMTGQAKPKEQTEAMYFGTVLEDFIGWEFTNRTGLEIKKMEAILQHPVYEIFLANIDFQIVPEEEGILECKNIGEYGHSEWKKGAPRYYYLQGQWYLGVTGLSHVTFAAMIGGNKFIIHKYGRDEEIIETMQEKANDFWYCNIVPQIPPDAIEGDLDNLKGMYPRHEEGEAIELSEEESDLLGELWTADVAIRDAEKQIELAKIKMQERMKTAESAWYNGELVCTWKADVNGKKTFKIKR